MSSKPRGIVLPREFYARPALVVAKELIGKTLVRRIDGRMVAETITETEAYIGPKDKDPQQNSWVEWIGFEAAAVSPSVASFGFVTSGVRATRGLIAAPSAPASLSLCSGGASRIAGDSEAACREKENKCILSANWPRWSFADFLVSKGTQDAP